MRGIFGVKLSGFFPSIQEISQRIAENFQPMVNISRDGGLTPFVGNTITFPSFIPIVPRFFVTPVPYNSSSSSDEKPWVILQAIVVTLASMHLDPTGIPLAP